MRHRTNLACCDLCLLVLLQCWAALRDSEQTGLHISWLHHTVLSIVLILGGRWFLLVSLEHKSQNTKSPTFIFLGPRTQTSKKKEPNPKSIPILHPVFLFHHPPHPSTPRNPLSYLPPNRPVTSNQGSLEDMAHEWQRCQRQLQCTEAGKRSLMRET